MHKNKKENTTIFCIFESTVLGYKFIDNNKAGKFSHGCNLNQPVGYICSLEPSLK